MINTLLLILFISVFAAISCGILKLGFKLIDSYFKKGDE